MKIIHKLVLLTVIPVLALLLITGLNYQQLNKINSASADVTENVLPSIILLAHITDQFTTLRREYLLHILEVDKEKKSEIEKGFKAIVNEMNSEIKKYEPMVYDDTDKANLTSIKSEFNAWLPSSEQVFKLSYENNTVEAMRLINQTARPQAKKVSAALQKAEDYNTELSQKMRADVTNAISSAVSIGVTLGLIAIVLLGVLSLIVARSISGPLNKMQSFIVDLSTRFDFTKRIEVQNKDEIGTSLVALNGLLDTLQASLQKLAHVGNQVGDCVNGLSNSSSELSSASRGVSESASSMAAGVEQVTVSVTHVADRAQQCDATAREAGRLAGTGGEVIDNTINSINQIADQVRQSAGQIENLKDRTNSITSVVNVIKDIADQTNLLALNAAIEAARAGELGRGFAVVADEVRKLAERTSSSTQEITTMVSEIQNEANHTVHTMQQTVRQVDNGVSMAHEASTAISNIRKSADDVVAQVSEISSSMREQSTASAMMAQQVERVAQMSEESSSVAEQTASEGGRLKRLGNELDEAISRYKVQ
ncbi:methyl-accepting chemotaxis protein [Deefgea sp. CFH1-16]|uniref:methyl-accepting chemotaxis protein n=1 Tax=Deefgea sp. CFH1-16 TaxID=2675457 RepID=UPI0015F36E05|nr:methyl-accepting chemotaxis protein [Deefgea sp. CFH1-16]MBM5573877.1 HAMP domain-containing protein [Deefgea sp. CFH1-16]